MHVAQMNQTGPKPMIAPLKPGATLAQPDGPIIETARLKLRRWREADIEPNTAMLSDPLAARFITSDGKPVTDAFVGWRNAAIMAGHWALHGIGMFVVEEKHTGKYVGRVGPWCPAGWRFATRTVDITISSMSRWWRRWPQN